MNTPDSLNKKTHRRRAELYPVKSRAKLIFGETRWKFRLIGDNGEIVGSCGSQAYSRRIDAEKTLDKYFPGFVKTFA